MQSIMFQGKRIVFSDRGAGDALILLHGFTENSRIWRPFIGILSHQFRVVAIDLPGFGFSECIGSTHSMSLMARVVKKVMIHLGIRRCVMAGHSMGGYVTQEFARLFPGMLKGICIFHSHPFSDTQEGVVNRLRAIELIKNDRFGYVAQFIPSLFSDAARTRFQKPIAAMVKEASSLSKEALLAAAIGMLEREDYTGVLSGITVPVLFIVGMQDTRVPVKRVGEMIQLPAHAEVLVLKNTGHMGFLEAKKETLSVLRDFTTRCMSR